MKQESIRSFDERLYSIEYSVSIIPEAGFRMFYRIFDAIGDWLQVASEKNLLLRVLEGRQRFVRQRF